MGETFNEKMGAETSKGMQGKQAALCWEANVVLSQETSEWKVVFLNG